MIDYGIVIVMMPLVLVGSFVGVLVNIMLPPILLSIILTVILVALTAQSFIKGMQIYNKESLAATQKQIELEKREKQVVMGAHINDISPPGTSIEKYNNFREESLADNDFVSERQPNMAINVLSEPEPLGIRPTSSNENFPQ